MTEYTCMLVSWLSLRILTLSWLSNQQQYVSYGVVIFLKKHEAASFVTTNFKQYSNNNPVQILPFNMVSSAYVISVPSPTDDINWREKSPWLQHDYRQQAVLVYNTSIFAAGLRGEGSKSSDLLRVMLHRKGECLLAIPQLSNTQENLNKHFEFIMGLRTPWVNRTVVNQSKGLAQHSDSWWPTRFLWQI